VGRPGRVSLVGAGPGDPGLITTKGLERLRAADVVVYDRLVDPRLLAEAKEGAELVDAGKARGEARMTQEQINETLVDKARAGHTVCRLKGGDPFVFGRGGEEAVALVEAGIPWEVVPGVTSAIAAAAYSGIPITHRGIATSFAVVTGTEDVSKGEFQVSWRQFASFPGTLVLLMAYANLGEIARSLLEAGMPANRPAVLVQWGTLARQRTVAGTLGNIAWRGAEAGLTAPVTVIIGDVAALRDQLSWFDTGPLFGKRVLVTRARSQASRLRALLEERGAWCVEFPAIRIVPVADPSTLDSALQSLRSYDWITFSSANGVRGVRTRMDHLGIDARAFVGVSVAAIGPATSASVQELLSIRPDLVPAEFVSEAVVEEFRNRGVKGKRVLVVRSDIGRDVLANGLKDIGAKVVEVVGYETKSPADSAAQARRAFSVEEGGIDIVTFTSSSSVENLVKLLERDSKLIDNAITACMGPVTAGRAKQLGLRVDIVSTEQTMEGLVKAIEDHVAHEPPSDRGQG
jgi:uroporphyrinogen III methyltransferase/synthase